MTDLTFGMHLCSSCNRRTTNIPRWRRRRLYTVCRCQTYEGGFAGCPGMEAHGGYSFCGVAALVMLGKQHLCDVRALLVSFRLILNASHWLLVCKVLF